MKRTLSNHDLTLLSAYLDGQLTSREQAQLTARLKIEPALLDELNSLQRTRQMLRKLPVRRAPRSFALKPDMLPARPTRQLFPVFRLASAVSGVFLLVMLAANLLVGRLASPALPTADDNFVAQEKGLQQEQPAMIVQWGTPTPEGFTGEAMGLGGGGGGGGTGGAMPESAKKAAPPYPAPTQIVEAPPPSATQPDRETEEFLGDTAVPSQDMSEVRDLGNGPILGVYPAPADDQAPTTDQPLSQPWAFPLRLGTGLVSGGLAFIVALTALAAFYFYRKERL